MGKTFLAFSLVAVLISGAFAQTAYEETNVLMADQKIMELGDKYLALLSDKYPEEATRLGTGIYHDQLLQRDRQSEIQRAKSIEALRKTLKEINPKKLSVQRRMQYYTLLGQVNKKVFETETLNQLTQDPLWYLQSLDSIYDIVEKNYASKEDRLRDALKRLEDLPNILEQGQENLQDASDLRMRLAVQKAQLAYSSFDELSAILNKYASAEQTKEKLEKAYKNAKEALKNYYEFLKTTLEKKDYVDFRLGEENYAKLLKEVYFLDGSISKYKKMIEAEVQKNQKILTDLLTPYLLEILGDEEKAKRTDDLGNTIVIPFDYYLVRNTKFVKAPKLREIADTYASTYENAVDFFTKKEFFNTPGLTLFLQNNPTYLRQAFSQSAYLAPYPFAPRQNNDLLLNIPSEDDINLVSQLFTYSDIKIDVAQKIIPGLSLSYDATYEDQQVLVKVSDDMFYTNGWSHYALKAAQEQGYFDDEEDILNIAWINYKRALYALAEIQMQTKELNYTQTLDMLISGGINDEEANAQIDFLAINPLYAVSYIVGAKEFERLNEQYKKKLKDDYKQKVFNEKILSLGRVPLNVLAEGLEQAYKAKSVESFFNTTYF
jgi:hypothetical protein